MAREKLVLLTGRLAEHSLRSLVAELSEELEFDLVVQVLPITVAALMTPAWIARKVEPEADAERYLVPGYCDGDLAVIEAVVKKPVTRGPRDLRELPVYFGRVAKPVDLSAYDIEIIAEINHAPRLALAEIVRQGLELADHGADRIDVGCDPGGTWSGVGDAVRALRDAGLRVSIDSFNPAEVSAAVRAGADLVLSVNHANRSAAVDWGAEVVVIPDEPSSLVGLADSIEYLASRGVRLRADPIVEPLGCGFAASLGRYLEVRRQFPEIAMMMGIGNLTELTDADSAGVNLLLLGFCQELGIRSVLTTQVINWARTSVRECDVARRLTFYSQSRRVPPKHVDARLVLLRDSRLFEPSGDELDLLATQIRDHNYRLFVAGGELHLVSAGIHLRDTDPFRLFDQLMALGTKGLDPSHAFYLGYELCKAATALTLGKQYEQDESLDWGFLTKRERVHRL